MKKVIKLTESDLHNIIAKSVKKYINEWGDRLSPDAMDDKAYMDDRFDQKMKLMQDAWEDKNRRIRQKYPGKSREWYEAMLDTENKIARNTINEEFQNNDNYSHFAVSKKSGKIVNGWDYHDEDPNDLRQWKKDYFYNDLIDYGFNPKDFRILTYKYLLKNGINPDDNSNWANNDETNADWVG